MRYEMELAFHIRTPDSQDWADKFQKEMDRLYDGENDWAEDFPLADRIYVGDEFCPNRLPSLSELEGFCALARENALKITLLTPVLTDKELENHSFLFDYLEKWEKGAEIVVNDWGVLLFLKRRNSHKAKLCTPGGVCLSGGRLFNKGFKDPRLGDAEGLALFSSETLGLLNESTFDHPEFQRAMRDLGVSRLERDLLPYGNPVCRSGESGIHPSFYFPFGYVTTGRVCWTASFRQAEGEKFFPAGPCARVCDDLRFELENENLSFRVFQNGNTIFYLYPFSLLSSFIKAAKRENIRLVYQGLN